MNKQENDENRAIQTKNRNKNQNKKKNQTHEFPFTLPLIARGRRGVERGDMSSGQS